MNFFKKWSWEFLLLILTGIHLIPLWSNTFFPTQDGPSHIYNAHLFLQLLDSDNWQVQQIFSLNIGWIPNSIAHIFFVIGLGLGIPVLIVEKIFVSLAIGLLPFSMSYVAGSFDKRAKLFSLIGFILAFHNLLHMGFYSFSISVPIALFTYGMWVRWHRELTTKRITLFLMMGMLCFLSHFSSFAVLIVMLTCSLVYSYTEEITLWYKNRNKEGQHKTLYTRLKQLFTQSVILCSLFAPGLVYQLMSKTTNSGHFKGFNWLWHKLFDDALFLTYTHDHSLIAHWFWYLFILCLTIHLILRVVKRKAFERRDIIILSLFFLTYIYFDLPAQSNGGGWVNHRLLIFVIIFIWLCLDRFPKFIQSAIACLILFISFQQLILFERDYKLLQHDLREFTDIAKYIEPHSIIKVDRNRGNSSKGIPHHTLRVGPLLHAPCYAGLAIDAAYSENYEANHRYFWVNWKNRPHSNPADYIVVWNNRGVSSSIASKYRNSYEEVMRRKHVKLLKLKKVFHQSLSNKLKAGEIVKLRFNENDPNRNRYNVNTKWQPGKSGWINISRLHDQQGMVSSEFPQTLRAEIPSGNYQIKFLLTSKHRAFSINAKLDGKYLLDDHRIPAGHYFEEPTRTTEVKNNRMDLVLSSHWKKGNSHNQYGYWSVKGIDIIPAQHQQQSQGIECKTTGVLENGFFTDKMSINFLNTDEKYNIYWSTNGGTPNSNDTLWNGETIAISESMKFRANSWFEGNIIASAGYDLTKIEKRTALLMPPLNIIPPHSLNKPQNNQNINTIEGWLKVTHEGMFNFNIDNLNGHSLTLNDKNIFKDKKNSQLWLKRGFYKFHFKSTYNDNLPRLYYSGPGIRHTSIEQSKLWMQRD